MLTLALSFSSLFCSSLFLFCHSESKWILMTWKVCHTCWQQTYPRNLRPASLPPFLFALPACLSADSKARHVLQPREQRLKPGWKNTAYIVFFPILPRPLHFPLWTEITRLSAAHLLCVLIERERERKRVCRKGFFPLFQYASSCICGWRRR